MPSCDPVSENSDFQRPSFDQAGSEDESVFQDVEETDEEEPEEVSSLIEPVADDVTTGQPEMENDSPSDWSGRLPTNLGVNDFRSEYDAQSTRYSMPPMGTGGDPFAPESSDVNPSPLAFQDSRETGNLDETPGYSYGQSFSSCCSG